MEIIDLRSLHARALELATSVVERISPDDLARPTPCAGWDLAALLAHMVGQNDGFADAVSSTGDVAPSAFAARPVGDRPGEAWSASTRRLTDAFAHADLDRPVLLAEISTEQRFPAGLVIGFHLLDTVVHGWDVATALGRDYRPDDELVGTTLQLARLVPDGEPRERPGASFAPSLPEPEGSPEWTRALALLGRSTAVTTRRGVECDASSFRS
jgi:uncharacterized protein (TIGR03086 family)